MSRPRSTADGPAADRTAADAVALSRRVTVTNRLGFHARAAAKFVKIASAFKAEIEVVRSDTAVSGKSILGLMMLAAGPGTELELRAHGPDAAAALAVLERLIGNGFDED